MTEFRFLDCQLFWILCGATALVVAPLGCKPGEPKGIVICFEHVGPTDKPIAPFLVSTLSQEELRRLASRIPCTPHPTNTLQVDEATLSRVLEIVRREPMEENPEAATREYLTFRATILEPPAVEHRLLVRQAMCDVVLGLSDAVPAGAAVAPQLEALRHRLSRPSEHQE